MTESAHTMEVMPAFAGIDWVWQHYAVCIVDGVGGRLEGGDGHAFEVWVDRDLDTAASTRDEQGQHRAR